MLFNEQGNIVSLLSKDMQWKLVSFIIKIRKEKLRVEQQDPEFNYSICFSTLYTGTNDSVPFLLLQIFPLLWFSHIYYFWSSDHGFESFLFFFLPPTVLQNFCNSFAVESRISLAVELAGWAALPWSQRVVGKLCC